MSKNLTVAVMLLGVFTTSASASDFDIRPYISAKVGIGTVEVAGSDFAPIGLTYSGVAGANIKTEFINLRAEFEYQDLSASHTISELSMSSVVTNSRLQVDANFYKTNVYIDFLENYSLKPYVGFGFGLGRFNENLAVNNISMGDVSDTGFTYSLYTGLGFQIFRGLYGDIGAFYNNTSIFNTNIETIGGTAGLRYNF